MRLVFIAVALVMGSSVAVADEDDNGAYALSHPDAPWWLSGQANLILQAQPGFHSPYEGDNSLRPDDHHATSYVATIYAGYELTPTTAIVVAGESAGATVYRLRSALPGSRTWTSCATPRWARPPTWVAPLSTR